MNKEKSTMKLMLSYEKWFILSFSICYIIISFVNLSFNNVEIDIQMIFLAMYISYLGGFVDDIKTSIYRCFYTSRRIYFKVRERISYIETLIFTIIYVGINCYKVYAGNDIKMVFANYTLKIDNIKDTLLLFILVFLIIQIFLNISYIIYTLFHKGILYTIIPAMINGFIAGFYYEAYKYLSFGISLGIVLLITIILKILNYKLFMKRKDIFDGGFLQTAFVKK